VCCGFVLLLSSSTKFILEMALTAGSRVLLQGLGSNLELNGRMGMLVDAQVDNGRFAVKLVGTSCSIMAVKPENLEAVAKEAGATSAGSSHALALVVAAPREDEARVALRIAAASALALGAATTLEKKESSISAELYQLLNDKVQGTIDLHALQAGDQAARSKLADTIDVYSTDPRFDHRQLRGGVSLSTNVNATTSTCVCGKQHLKLVFIVGALPACRRAEHGVKRFLLLGSSCIKFLINASVSSDEDRVVEHGSAVSVSSEDRVVQYAPGLGEPRKKRKVGEVGKPSNEAVLYSTREVVLVRRPKKTKLARSLALADRAHRTGSVFRLGA